MLESEPGSLALVRLVVVRLVLARFGGDSPSELALPGETAWIVRLLEALDVLLGSVLRVGWTRRLG